MLEVVLIRHPPSKANEERIIQGQIDTDLEPGYEGGVNQLTEELIKLGEFCAFFSSDLKRAELPAQRVVDYLRKQQGLPLEYISTPLVRERHWGGLQGKRYEEVDTKGVDILDYLFFLDNIARGENLDTIRARIERFRREHMQRYEGRIGIMGHSYQLNYQRNLLVGGDITNRPYERLAHLSITRLLIDGQRVRELG